MNAKRVLLTLFCLILLVGSLPVTAQIVITDPTALKIDYQRVQVTIEDQIASTHIDMQFTNHSRGLVEGTFVFPLPLGAAVDRLTMHVDGMAIDARILPADEARAIYDEIVRQYRDPALLEYIGQSAIQANVFPIPPGDSRRIEIRYAQVLQVDNGLLHYVYPLHAVANAGRVIDQMTLAVDVTGDDLISSIYSPSHPIAVKRADDGRGFRATFEQGRFTPGDDFSLYYGLAGDGIGVSLLSYRESATEDGFFLLLVQPPLRVDTQQIVPKDVIVVLDQSGSMRGSMWDQARQAAGFVLANLQEQDRFNVIAFSSGVRVYSTGLQPAAEATGAINWMNGMQAEGMTDINLALLTALEMADPERPTTILFLTDGEATEGVIDTPGILANLHAAITPNVRIFTFGVGNSVNTQLLDSIVRDFHGTGTYVRPSQRIDEAVASLYNKISAPVLTAPALDFGGALVELLYPDYLPDLFAGEQLTVVGRYRQGTDDLSITLTGSVGGEAQTFVYDDLSLRSLAGGEPFIARLWATRRIGDLLNSIRLHGENPEAVESIIALSLRYGIITPYTSFLIEEDDIFGGEGRARMLDTLADALGDLSRSFTGSAAVDAAVDMGAMTQAEAPAPAMALPNQPMMEELETGDEPAPASNPLRTVRDKTFIRQDGVWTDTTYEPEAMTPETVAFLSDDYFDLLDRLPELGAYFALGDQVIVVIDGAAYQVTPAA